jgi:7-keto-8-aminopelargonate synthetase-like enzyme
MNHSIKRETQVRRIKSINLLRAFKSQVIAQFADDTFLSLATKEEVVLAAKDTLNKFCCTFGLMINEQKSAAYFWHPQGAPWPPWTLLFNW